jgi:hypothetical protein
MKQSEQEHVKGPDSLSIDTDTDTCLFCIAFVVVTELGQMVTSNAQSTQLLMTMTFPCTECHTTKPVLILNCRWQQYLNVNRSLQKAVNPHENFNTTKVIFYFRHKLEWEGKWVWKHLTFDIGFSIIVVESFCVLVVVLSLVLFDTLSHICWLSGWREIWAKCDQSW